METIKRLTTATLTALWLFHGAVVAEDAQPAAPTAQAGQKAPAADAFPMDQIEQIVAPIAAVPRRPARPDLHGRDLPPGHRPGGSLAG